MTITDNYNFSDDDDRVNFRQFIRVLARFRPIKKNKASPLNSRDEKLQFAFSMYDLNGDKFITKDELLSILNMMVGANITPEQYKVFHAVEIASAKFFGCRFVYDFKLQNIAERTIEEADVDHDGKISFEEFCHAMEKADIEQKMSIRFLQYKT
uniref:EF-hand domain-containing protein n=1 Tax=Romanomermis culicivorax TaxID=13658 RepID=A0A915KM06_ROMCU